MKLSRPTAEVCVFAASLVFLATAATAAVANAETVHSAASAAAATADQNHQQAGGQVKNVEQIRLEKLAAYADQREQLTPEQLKELLSLVGFKGQNLKEAWAIAMKESTGHPTSHNDNASTGDNSYGLFQINMRGYLGDARREKFELKSNNELFNPVKNAEIAYFMSSGGDDWGSWGVGSTAYNGGKAGSYYEWLAQYPKE